MWKKHSDNGNKSPENSLPHGERGSQPPRLPADAFPAKSSQYAAGTTLLKLTDKCLLEYTIPPVYQPEPLKGVSWNMQP